MSCSPDRDWVLAGGAEGLRHCEGMLSAPWDVVRGEHTVQGAQEWDTHPPQWLPLVYTDWIMISILIQAACESQGGGWQWGLKSIFFFLMSLWCWTVLMQSRWTRGYVACMLQYITSNYNFNLQFLGEFILARIFLLFSCSSISCPYGRPPFQKGKPF